MLEKIESIRKLGAAEQAHHNRCFKREATANLVLFFSKMELLNETCYAEGKRF